MNKNRLGTVGICQLINLACREANELTQIVDHEALQQQCGYNEDLIRNRLPELR
jgi:hypothetical protein